MGDLRQKLAARGKPRRAPVPARFSWDGELPAGPQITRTTAEWGRLSSFITIAIVLVLAIVLAYRLSPVAHRLSSIVRAQ